MAGITLDDLEVYTAMKEKTAIKLCEGFNSDPEDDWTYKSVPKGNGLYLVSTSDSEGFIGYL